MVDAVRETERGHVALPGSHRPPSELLQCGSGERIAFDVPSELRTRMREIGRWLPAAAGAAVQVPETPEDGDKRRRTSAGPSQGWPADRADGDGIGTAPRDDASHGECGTSICRSDAGHQRASLSAGTRVCHYLPPRNRGWSTRRAYHGPARSSAYRGTDGVEARGGRAVGVESPGYLGFGGEVRNGPVGRLALAAGRGSRFWFCQPECDQFGPVRDPQRTARA